MQQGADLRQMAGQIAGHGPFHAGEVLAQAFAGVRMENAPIRDFMPEQHRQFFPLLPFLPLAVSDPAGRLAATVLTGQPGFVSSPDPRLLRIAALPDASDPARKLLRVGAKVGILGIDLGTRRRNRVNGRVASVTSTGFDVAVEQSFGNCPQYIQGRLASERASIEAQVERLTELDADARRTITEADTFFVASSSGERGDRSGGVDMSHRGGRPGFVKIEGDTLTIPDFHGNQYFNTLGNFLLNPNGVLLFPDFEHGDLLHLSGTAEVDWSDEAVDAVAGAERVWRFRVTEAWRRRGALPLRWQFRDYAPTTQRTGIWSPDPLDRT
jgi:uncharacterized protein